MVFSTLVCAAVLADTPQKNPVTLVSAVFQKYHKNLKGSGNIELNLIADEQKLNVMTDYQFARPGRIYIKQKINKMGGNIAFVVNDGNYLVFPRVAGTMLNKGNYSLEVMLKPNGTLMELDEMYHVGSPGLSDRSFPLDLVFGCTDDLQLANQLFGHYKYEGKSKLKDESVDIVSGQFKSSPTGPFIGIFKMYINDKQELVRYFSAESHNVGSKQIPTTYVYDIDANINENAKIDSKLFKIPAVLLKR